MPIVKSMIRNSSHKNLYSGILFLISCIAAVILYYNHEIYTKVDVKDVTSLFSLCVGILTVIVSSSFANLSLLFVFEDLRSVKEGDILRSIKEIDWLVVSKRLWNHLSGHEYLWIFTLVDVAGLFVLVWLHLFMGLKFNLGYFLVIISASILFACMTMLTDYDDVDLSSSQNMEQSIGACWANGAYSAFYKEILTDMPQRMSQFEDENKIKLLVKKLVIICPLSCNANGSLEGKDGNMKNSGHLKKIIVDEGANNNRCYKTNVYKICEPYTTYIAAEIPSPLATLYEMRDEMDSVILNYHRECFIKTLRDLVKSYQCIILEYDDLNSLEPLHSFLLSELEDKKFVNVIN